jgi:hypothetical protein
MKPLPANPLRANLGTWAVPARLLPAVARAMLDALPPEAFDPLFVGQNLDTTYFDTAGLGLRKARRKGDRYLTLRLRRYDAPGGPPAWALSAKTEGDKWRAEVEADEAHALLDGPAPDTALRALLPAHLLARLVALVDGDPLGPVTCVHARRYAVEDDRDRLTLDVDVRADTGRCLPAAVLEFKCTAADEPPPGGLTALRLPPVKLSKFLWATKLA